VELGARERVVSAERFSTPKRSRRKNWRCLSSGERSTARL